MGIYASNEHQFSMLKARLGQTQAIETCRSHALSLSIPNSVETSNDTLTTENPVPTRGFRGTASSYFPTQCVWYESGESLTATETSLLV